MNDGKALKKDQVPTSASVQLSFRSYFIGNVKYLKVKQIFSYPKDTLRSGYQQSCRICQYAKGIQNIKYRFILSIRLVSLKNS